MGQLKRMMRRRTFMATLTVLGISPWRLQGAEAEGAPRIARRDRPAFRHDLTRVQSVVGASHSDIDRVRSLVLEQPALAKGAWDWGFGDWETALGAAAHTGRREIAEFLIAHGARPTLFSAAMLGQVDVVRAFVEADPAVAGVHGAHGIPLINHARAGRDDAARVVDYLIDRFGDETAPAGFPGDETVESRYGGRYRFSALPDVELVVGVPNRWLMIGTGDTPQTRILPVATDTFHPTGAPAVRLAFDVVDGRARSVRVRDGLLDEMGLRVV